MASKKTHIFEHFYLLMQLSFIIGFLCRPHKIPRYRKPASSWLDISTFMPINEYHTRLYLAYDRYGEVSRFVVGLTAAEGAIVSNVNGKDTE